MEISEIKQRLTLPMVLNHYGLKADKSHRISCPFHEDKTPSMQLYYKTQTAYCFSANCKTHGKAMDVIDFIMHKENISKHEAIEKAKSFLVNSATWWGAPSYEAQGRPYMIHYFNSTIKIK